MILGLFGIEKPTTLTDECSSHHLSKRPPLAGEGDHYREPQLVKSQRTASHSTQPKLIRLCQSPCAKGSENIVENRVERM